MPKTRAENLSWLRQAAAPVEPGQPYEIGRFQPSDAPGIALLYYAVYGEGFPVDQVYDPEIMIAQNASRDLYQLVARTAKGEVVGLYAFFRNPPGRRIMESGSWLVHPAYRNTSLALRLASRIHENPPPELGVEVLFGQAVCDHLMTQKIGVRYDTRQCAIELEAMPPRPATDAGFNPEFALRRISFLDGVILYKDTHHTLRLPRQYDAVLRELVRTRRLDRELVPDGDAPAPAQEARASVLAMDQASLVKMTVTELGQDLARRVAAMEEEFPDRHVYQVVLPLTQPGMTHVVQALREAGYFLGGMLPLWFDHDALLMQKVAGEPDPASIKLLTEDSRWLLEQVLEDRRAVLATLGTGGR